MKRLRHSNRTSFIMNFQLKHCYQRGIFCLFSRIFYSVFFIYTWYHCNRGVSSNYYYSSEKYICHVIIRRAFYSTFCIRNDIFFKLITIKQIKVFVAEHNRCIRFEILCYLKVYCTILNYIQNSWLNEHFLLYWLIHVRLAYRMLFAQQ